MKPGYKETEVGVIPEDWNVSALSTVANIVDPQPDHRTPPEAPGGAPYIGISDFPDDNSVDWDGSRKIIAAALDRQRASFQLRPGDIIFGKIGTIGQPKFVPIMPFRYALSANVLLIQPSIEPFFAMAWLRSSAVQASINRELHSTSQAAFGIHKMRALLVALPSVPEQRAIAEALRDADALIESLEHLIAKKRHLKQGAMQDLPTGKKRLPGFTGEWQVRPFDDVLCRVNVKASQINTCDYQVSGQYPVVDQGQDVVIGYSDRHDKCFRCPDDGVIVFGDHTCIVKFVDFDFLVGADGTQVMVAKHGYSTRFFAYQLQHEGISPTGYNRHFKFLKELDYRVPSRQEQSAIAAILSDMDAEIAVLEAKLAKARQLKQGMMQELLTGRIRFAAKG